MSTGFPFLEVPPELAPVLGDRDRDSRVYRKKGSPEEAGAWFDLVSSVAGATVSPGGVLMYCPVSRAAIYKRMKEGKLTAFNFYPSEAPTKFFAGLLRGREMPYCLIPVSEAKAWRVELEERALASGKISAKELEEANKRGDWVYRVLEHGKISLEELQGLKPDPDGLFLGWNSRWHKKHRSKKGGSK